MLQFLRMLFLSDQILFERKYRRTTNHRAIHKKIFKNKFPYKPLTFLGVILFYIIICELKLFFERLFKLSSTIFIIGTA